MPPNPYGIGIDIKKRAVKKEKKKKKKKKKERGEIKCMLSKLRGSKV